MPSSSSLFPLCLYLTEIKCVVYFVHGTEYCMDVCFILRALLSLSLYHNFIMTKYINHKIKILCRCDLSIKPVTKILNSKYRSDVVNPLIPPLLLRHVESSGDQVLLVVLNLDHFPLDGLVCDELVDEDGLGLAHPVDPVEALPLAGRVPGRV